MIDGAESAYDWTAEGRLEVVYRDGIQLAQMTYDADGRGVRRWSAPVRRRGGDHHLHGSMYRSAKVNG